MEDFNNQLLQYIDNYLGIASRKRPLYHYTSLEALIDGIIPEKSERRKEVCLRTTHCRFVNDKAELLNGIAAISHWRYTIDNSCSKEEYAQRMLTNLESMFLISFSDDDNSLPMWNSYAHNSMGVAIGFKPIKSLSFEDVVLRCWYSIDKLMKHIDTFPEEKRSIIFFNYLGFLPCLLKDEAYNYENEIRLIGKFKDLPTKFRVKNGLIIPYKEVLFPKEQIESITLGPCQNMNYAEYSLRKFLDSRGFEHVIIKQSKIPYRNL